MKVIFFTLIPKNIRYKDENAHRFALNATRGKLLERERESFGILYTGYLLSIVKIKKEIDREREIPEK